MVAGGAWPSQRAAQPRRLPQSTPTGVFFLSTYEVFWHCRGGSSSGRAVGCRRQQQWQHRQRRRGRGLPAAACGLGRRARPVPDGCRAPAARVPLPAVSGARRSSSLHPCPLPCPPSLHPLHPPQASSTASLISCSSPKCSCGSPRCGCAQQQCTYKRSYAEESSSSGILLEDVLAMHDGGRG